MTKKEDFEQLKDGFEHEETPNKVVKKPKKEKALNIYEKLLEIRKQVKYIQKNAKGFKFDYADETSILSLLRPHMDKYGLLLEFDMEKPEQVAENVTQVGFIFTWINVESPDEKIQKTIYLQTVAADPQKMGGLMTYANRYFLYKYFNVPTDKWDIDAQNAKFPFSISEEQAEEIEKLLNGDEIRRKKMYQALEVKCVEDIPANKYNWVIENLKKTPVKKNEDNQTNTVEHAEN